MCGTYSYIWTRIEINIMANRINMFTDSKWMVHFPLRPLCSVNVSTRRCDLSDMPKSALADMCHVAATVSQRYPHQHTQQRETYLYLSRISHICKDIWANICAYWQCHKWWCSSARPLFLIYIIRLSQLHLRCGAIRVFVCVCVLHAPLNGTTTTKYPLEWATSILFRTLACRCGGRVWG